jgi:ribosomal protein S18 acetylase RimI-like enzyme
MAGSGVSSKASGVSGVSGVTIRPYRPDDLDDLYRICLLTGDNGRDATPLYRDPVLVGQLFAAPYALFEPSLAFVAQDEAGVGGYVLGARDSQAFEERLERDWWPRLRRRYPDPPADLAPADWTADQQMAHLIHHRYTVPDELARSYPSHLHIDLLPRLQGRGQGRQLIDTLTGALRRQGSPGVHLNVSPGNDRAPAFYQHVGFTELPLPASYTRLFVMDLTG